MEAFIYYPQFLFLTFLSILIIADSFYRSCQVQLLFSAFLKDFPGSPLYSRFYPNFSPSYPVRFNPVYFFFFVNQFLLSTFLFHLVALNNILEMKLLQFFPSMIQSPSFIIRVFCYYFSNLLLESWSYFQLKYPFSLRFMALI